MDITGGLRLCTMNRYYIDMIKDDYCLFGFVLCVSYIYVSIRTNPQLSAFGVK